MTSPPNSNPPATPARTLGTWNSPYFPLLLWPLFPPHQFPPTPVPAASVQPSVQQDHVPFSPRNPPPFVALPQETVTATTVYNSSTREANEFEGAQEREEPQLQALEEKIATKPGRRTRAHHCPMCKRRFSKRYPISYHLSQHRGERVQCEHPGCDQTFTAKSSMKRHFQRCYEPSV